MARLPQPPLFDQPETIQDIKNSIKDIHQNLQDIVRFLREFNDNGAKHFSFSQDQINSFTDLSFLGTVLFNETTGESNVSYLDNGEVKWRSI